MLKSWEKYKNSEKVKFYVLFSVTTETMYILKIDCLCLLSEKKKATLKEVFFRNAIIPNNPVVITQQNR